MTATPTTFDPDPDSDAGSVVSDLFPTASFAAASGGAPSQGGTRLAAGDGAMDALAYTDVNPDTGAMRLLASFRAEDSPFSAPVVVAEASGVVAVTIAQHDGVWTTAWTEIEGAALGNAFPSSQIRASQSTDGGATWSAPVLVATLDGVANKLELISGGNQLGLLFLHTEEGPAAARFRLGLAASNQDAWQVLSEDAAENWVENASSVGGASDAVIVYRTSSGAIQSFHWLGADIGTPVTISETSGSAYGLAYDPSTGYQLAWSNNGGDIMFSTWEEGSTEWSPASALSRGVYPSEVTMARLPSAASARYVVAWIDSADVKSIWQVFVDSEAQVLSEPVLVSDNLSGRHSGLKLWVGLGGRVRALARFDDETVSLRQYDASFGGSSAELRLEIVRVLADGGIELRLIGEAIGEYRLEVSTDLLTWQLIPGLTLSDLNPLVTIPAEVTDGSSEVFIRGARP